MNVFAPPSTLPRRRAPRTTGSPCRSLPVPGSFIAMCGDDLAAAEPGSQRGAAPTCTTAAGRARGCSLCSGKPTPDAPARASSSPRSRFEAEVRGGSAPYSSARRSEQASLPPASHRSRLTTPSRSHCSWVRRDLMGDEVRTISRKARCSSPKMLRSSDSSSRAPTYSVTEQYSVTVISSLSTSRKVRMPADHRGARQREPAISVRTDPLLRRHGLIPPPEVRGRLGPLRRHGTRTPWSWSGPAGLGFTLSAIEGYLARIPVGCTPEDLALHRALLARGCPRTPSRSTAPSSTPGPAAPSPTIARPLVALGVRPPVARRPAPIDHSDMLAYAWG